jgi:copper chaperone CopZ
MSIEGATAALDGVTGSSVDIPGKTVTVTYEGSQVDMDAIVSAIEDQGYDVAR